MSANIVTIVDYGIGNIFSVQRALESCGARVELAADGAALAQAGRLVLPGVGAFADGMRGLRERGLIDPIRNHASAGKPLLGICLGMQMLAEQSTEFGTHQGLGLIAGQVVPVPATASTGQPLKIPHIGWNGLLRPAHDGWAGSLLESTPEGTPVYLVHSFHFVPTRDEHRLAECDCGGHRICAAVRMGPVTGCQFHPEKSGPAGLAMLKRFLAE
jgi:glutamine amidotransferase